MPNAEKDAWTLPDRLRAEGDAAARPGQLDALYGMAAEVERLLTGFSRLGFCPNDGESMPCPTCGAGL